MDKQPGPFRKADFIAWLESMPEEYIVGRAGDLCDCPYANYLFKSVCLHNVWVGAGGIVWGGAGGIVWGTVPRRRKPHPWLIRFIRAVDEIKPRESYVTAGRCLRILKGE